MNSNLYQPSYYYLLKLNPLLQRKTITEVEELISTMTELGYEWDNQNLCFHNAKINSSIRTQGLDLFTAKSFREFYEDLVDEINANPHLYHQAGSANYQLRKASSFFSKFLIVLLTLGWFIFSFKTILYISIVIIALWLFLFIRANKYNAMQRKIRYEVWHKNYQKRESMNNNN